MASVAAAGVSAETNQGDDDDDGESDEEDDVRPSEGSDDKDEEDEDEDEFGSGDEEILTKSGESTDVKTVKNRADRNSVALFHRCLVFPVRHPERQRTAGEEEEGGRGGEEEEEGLMMSHFDWWTVSPW